MMIRSVERAKRLRTKTVCLDVYLYKKGTALPIFGYELQRSRSSGDRAG